MKALIIILFFFTTPSWAVCISDIYFVGAEANSVAYKIEESKDDYLILSTESSGGIKVGKIWYCPDNKVEYLVYGRVVFMGFNKEDYDVLDSLSETEYTGGTGLEIKWSQWENIEWIADGELRYDLAFNGDYNSLELRAKSYFNLKFMGGLRYRLPVWKQHDFGFTTKLGVLVSPEENSDPGGMLSLSMDLLKRLGARSSLKALVFYDHYLQNFRGNDNERRELGLRLNYLFRY